MFASKCFLLSALLKNSNPNPRLSIYECLFFLKSLSMWLTSMSTFCWVFSWFDNWDWVHVEIFKMFNSVAVLLYLASYLFHQPFNYWKKCICNTPSQREREVWRTTKLTNQRHTTTVSLCMIYWGSAVRANRIIRTDEQMNTESKVRSTEFSSEWVWSTDNE